MDVSKFLSGVTMTAKEFDEMLEKGEKLGWPHEYFLNALKQLQKINEKSTNKEIKVGIKRKSGDWLVFGNAIRLFFFYDENRDGYLYRWRTKITFEDGNIKKNKLWADGWNYAMDYMRFHHNMKFMIFDDDVFINYCSDHDTWNVIPCRRCDADKKRNAERKKKNNHKKTYVIGHDDGNDIKIGIATNPEKRLAQLSTGSPHNLKILCTIDGDAEKDLHDQLCKYRTRGEWFNIDRDVLFSHLQAQNLQYKLA
jgi:hypothetical protein